MVVWRYTSAGIFDGIVVHDGAAGGSSYDNGTEITFDAAGNGYVTGYSINAANDYDMVVWKYNTEGELDTTFGDNGIVVHGESAGGGGSYPNDSATDIELNDSSNIFITGKSVNSDGNADMVIWKYE